MVSLAGVRDGDFELKERAARMQKAGADDIHGKGSSEQPLLQRSVFPWMEAGGQEDQAFVGEHFDTTTPYEVASHFGVPEKIFEEFVAKEIHEADSCWGLPFTLLMVASYIGMMISHHDAATVYAVESAIVNKLENIALYRYTQAHVGFKNIHDIHDYEDFYSWAHQGFFPLILESMVAAWEIPEPIDVDFTWTATTTPKNTSGTTSTTTTTETSTTTATTTSTTSTTWRVADPTYFPLFSRVVGGMRWQQERTSGTAKCKGSKELVKAYGRQCSGGLLYELDPDPLGGMTTSEPQRITWFWLDDNITASQNRLYKMESEGWIDPLTQKVEIALATYNGEYGLHTLVTINLYFNRAGAIWKRIIIESVFSEQYTTHSTMTYVFDAVWIGCLVYIIVSEGREIYITFKRFGCGWAFVEDYVSLWNLVDILSLLYGVAIIGVAMGATRLTERLNDKLESIGVLDGSWYGDEVVQYRTACEEYVDYLTYLVFLGNRARILFACYPWVIALRLLKAFSAQPRLALVTRTLYAAWKELVHFAFVIVFVYFAFIMSGMVLFSNHMQDFATVSRAFFTAWRCMIGDFDWEEMVAPGRYETLLWFFSFQITTFFCFLNMLLVILHSAYGEVKESISSADTLWEEAFQSYERFVGIGRGEMVRLTEIIHSVVDNRESLKVLYDPDIHETVDDKMKPFIFRDGTIRVVTIDFLRTNVMKMRTQQARRMLEEAIMFFYSSNKSKSHIEQMALLMREMKHLHKDIHRFMAGGDGSDSDIDVGALERKLSKNIEHQRNYEYERRSKFAEELRLLKIDLHHAHLWVGTDTVDEIKLKPKLEKKNTTLLTVATQYPEGPSEDAFEEEEATIRAELERHRELEAEIKQLEDQKLLAKKLAAKAMKGIGILEPQLLEVTEESSEIAAKFQGLKRRVMELWQEQKRLDYQHAKGKREKTLAVRSRHETFGIVHMLSNENESLTRDLQKVRRERFAAAKYRAKPFGYLDDARATLEPQLDVVREVQVQAARVKTKYYAELLEHAEKAASSRGAGGLRDIMRLLTKIQDMNNAKTMDYEDVEPVCNDKTGDRTFVYLPKTITRPDDPGKLPEQQRFKKLFVEYGGNREMDEEITICSV